MGACQSRRRLVNDGNRGRRKSTGTEETEVTATGRDGGNGERRETEATGDLRYRLVRSERNVVVGERLGGSRGFRDRRRTSAHVILGPGHRADGGAGAPAAAAEQHDAVAADPRAFPLVAFL